MFADSGQTIYAHTCLKSKHTHLSIGQPKHCCAEKVVAGKCEVKKSTCCEVSSKYLKQDFVSEQIVPDFIAFDAAIVPVSRVFVACYPAPLIQRAANSSPPLLAIAKSEIAFTQTFRI